MGQWVNDPSVPGGRRWVEDGQGVETLETGQVFNWEGQQYNVPDTAPAVGGFGGAPAAHTPIPRVPLRRTPIIPGTGDRSTRGEALAADILNWGNVPFSGDWNYNLTANAGNFGIDIQNWLNAPTPETQALQAQQTPATETIPELSFGSELLPEDQALLDALRSLGTTITAPELPPVPPEMFEVDPGLDRLVTHAQNRQTQINDLIDSLRSEREDEVGRATNKWVTLGRWLSDWASTGDWGQSGAAMTRALQQNQDMRDELRRETLQYIQMGWSAEDAVIQAQVALLSGQADARRQQAAAGYQRDTAQTQLDFSAQTANAQNSRGVALAIAEATRDAMGRAREARTQAAQALTGSPQYSRQAFGEIARNVTSDPGTRDALTGVMEEQQLNSALMGIVAQYAGSQDSAARRQGLQILRQWDPTLNEDALKNSTPQQLMLRLTRTPQARAAFEANREYLIRSQQFGGMMQPAQ